MQRECVAEGLPQRYLFGTRSDEEEFPAGTVVLILIAGGCWLTIQNGAMRSRVAQQQAAEGREEALRRQLAQRAAPETQKPPNGVEPTPLLASLVFLPSLSRAAGN